MVLQGEADGPAAGEAEFLLSDVMTAPAQLLQLTLRSVQSRRSLPKGCTVTIRAEELADMNAVVKCWGGGTADGESRLHRK